MLIAGGQKIRASMSRELLKDKKDIMVVRTRMIIVIEWGIIDWDIGIFG
jgi:urease alpha subunit